MAAAVEWFYMQAGERVGPVGQDELCSMFRKGALSLETQVFCDAFGKWVAASSIGGFRAVCGVGESGDEPSRAASEYDEALGAPVGIGGWLLLPALGLVLGPIACALMGLAMWTAAAKLQTRGAAEVGDSMQILAGMLGAFALYQLYAAVMFFSRKRAAVGVMIGGYMGAVVLAGMNMALSQSAEVIDWARGVGPALVGSIIWIAYFSVSKRVKATFVY